MSQIPSDLRYAFGNLTSSISDRIKYGPDRRPVTPAKRAQAVKSRGGVQTWIIPAIVAAGLVYLVFRKG